MTDETAGADDLAGEEAGEAAGGRKMSGRTLILFIVLPVLLVAGGVGAAFMTGMLGGGEATLAEGEAGDQPVDPSKIVFYELPELIINLQSDNPRGSFVKFKVMLELHDPAVLSRIEPLMPRVVDTFQIYLRELRPSDLEGSAGLFRLKEEILKRINMDIRPHQVADVLFTEMIVQ